MKYVVVTWPGVQNYMGNPEFRQKTYFDPEKNVWFIPKEWVGDVSGIDIELII